MREFFFYPPIFILSVGVFLFVFFLLFQVSANERMAGEIETFVLCIFLVSLAEVSIQPFSELRPRALASLDKTFGSALVQISIYIFSVILIRTRFRDFFRDLMLLKNDPFLVLIMFLALLSAFWSETPLVTFKSSLVLVGTSLFAVHIAKYYNIQKMTSILRFLCALILIVGAIFSIAVPSIGVNEKGWQGIMGYPIRTGTFAALGLVFWVSHMLQTKRRKVQNIVVILILLLVLVRSNSIQALFTLIALLGVYFLHSILNNLKFRQAIAASILFFIVGLCLFVVIKYNAEGIISAFGRDSTLTGRTNFWPNLISEINNHNPLLGFGVKGFWQPWRDYENPARYIINPNGFVPPNAHSGFLDLALEIGWLGLFLFGCSFLKVTINSLIFAIKNKSNVDIVPLILVIYIFIANISETQLFSDVYIWFIYVYLVVSPELNRNDRHQQYLNNGLQR